jgi:O-antigen ligase
MLNHNHEKTSSEAMGVLSPYPLPQPNFLWMFVLTMPLMSFAIFYKIQLSFVAGFLGLAVFAIRYLNGKERISPFLPWPLLAFFGVVVASSLMSLIIVRGDFMGETPLFKSFKQILQLAFMIGLFVWIGSIVNSEHRFRLVTKYLYLSTAVVCLYGIYQFFGVLRGWPLSAGFDNPAYSVRDASAPGFMLAGSSGGFYDIPRVYSTAPEPGFFANFLLLPFSISLASVLTRKGIKRGSILLEYLVFGVTSAVLILTFSRAGYVAAIVSLLVILFLSRGWRESRKYLVSALAVGAVVFVIGFLVASVLNESSDGDKRIESYVFEMFERTTDPLEDSTFGRLNADAAAVGMFWDHPVLGVGIGNFGFLYDHYAPTPEVDSWPSAQSLYLGLLAETGILGLITFVSFLVWAVRKGRQAINRFAGNSFMRVVTVGLMASLIAIHFQFIFIYTLNFTQAWFNLALLGAVSRLACASVAPVSQAFAGGRE